MDTSRSQVHELVEHLFRHRAGQILASLSRTLGPANLDVAEEAVQDALMQALRKWPFRGVPENPAAWLAHVAGNKALDTPRRRSSLQRKLPEIEARLRLISNEGDGGPDRDGALADDQLAMIFACCHPCIPDDSRVALTLNVVGGFSAAEVASAFLTP
jgi:RNA polymerase sigma-70 factor (ECF subfamily)